MPHRTFTDSAGRAWQVWSVAPSRVERRRPTAVGTPPGGLERRVRHEPRVVLAAEWVDGWLVFETRDEKRRLSRYPDDWSTMSEDELRELCRGSEHVRLSRTMIEPSAPGH